MVGIKRLTSEEMGKLPASQLRQMALDCLDGARLDVAERAQILCLASISLTLDQLSVAIWKGISDAETH